MVESKQQEGDGVNRPIQYAKFRTDKEPEEGHSAELVSLKLDEKHYDDLDARPKPVEGIDTLLDLFNKNLKEGKDEAFLGTREKLQEGKFGEYQWQTYGEVDTNKKNLAKGLMTLELCPTQEDGFRFCGIWAKNRWEWTTTLLGCMHYKITSVGFYDAMGTQAVDFILNQTQMTTIICSDNYVSKIVQMKADGLAQHITALVSLDDVGSDVLTKAEENNIKVHTFAAVMQAGESAGESAPAFEESTKDDYYMFSYTSGTTGDSKGVMLTHNNILSQAWCSIGKLNVVKGDAVISYLPYPHSYEQILTANSMMFGLRIGFYQGDPLKLIEDCAALKPAFFPSVPRLYNRIYGKLTAGIEAKPGAVRWLINKGLNAKMAALNRDGRVTHGCYDKLFAKFRNLLGGKVKLMTTGSAPIDKKVLDFLKCCFSVPIIEGYGLTESATGGGTTDMKDPVTGHVGGPSEAVKIRLKDLPEMEYLSSDKPYPRGEICLTGPCIFKGYYKREDKTAEAFDQSGWFMTGDVGMIYPNGSVKIIDRSKNIFKLSQGEYIAPEKLENVFVLSPFIAQSMVYGHSLESCVVAIVVPDEEEIKKWGGGGKNAEEVLKDPAFKQAIMDNMLELAKNNKLSSLEKPKDIYLTSDPFTIENDQLTPTFKLKRNNAQKAYQEQIDAMYAALEPK